MIGGCGNFTLPTNTLFNLLILTEDFHHFLWHKAVPLKVNIFVWQIFLNRLATKDNLRARHVLDVSQVSCAASCGAVEDRDHLFFLCVITTVVCGF